MKPLWSNPFGVIKAEINRLAAGDDDSAPIIDRVIAAQRHNDDAARKLEAARVQFRLQVFHDLVRAGTVSPVLPPDTLDRWLNRMWRMLHQPEEQEPK